MQNSTVVVSGMGVVTPLGVTVNSLWENLLLKKCAAKNWNDLEEEDFRNTMACRVEDIKVVDEKKRGSMMAIEAVKQALQQSELPLHQKIGVFTGTTLGESRVFEEMASTKERNFYSGAGHVFADMIQSQFQLTGPKIAFGTACAAGNYAIGSAAHAIRTGRIDAAIAGGVDPFSKIAMVGFSRSRAMTPDYCRPFDENRKGMQLGEGAAFLVLERVEDVLERNIEPLAIIGGLGLSCDAYHPTKPKENGKQMALAMQNCLKISKKSVADVNSVCAHGSGTWASDLAEAHAICTVFGNNAIPVWGIKGALGHTLGAATAIEVAMSVQSLRMGRLLPTTNHEKLLKGMDLQVTTEPQNIDAGQCIVNAGYAFGGINSALLIEEYR